MAGNPNRQFDKTYLSLDKAEERGLIHRDYIAHCHRWSHVVKHLGRSQRYAEAIVLDVGCGKELPLAKSLYVNKMTPKLFVGVDMNKFAAPEMLTKSKFPLRLIQQKDITTCTAAEIGVAHIDFAESDGYIDKPNVIVCFEVLEHVTPGHARKMLQYFYDNLDKTEGVAFVSTPCFNGDAANNHINEMTYEALGRTILDVGFKIRGHWGTFASISDYKEQLKLDGFQEVFDRLREFYDTNFLATIFAPLYPQHSRNVIWELEIPKTEDERNQQSLMFPSWENLAEPWSQHPNFKDLRG